MGHEKKPGHVIDAIQRNDKTALSVMGRAGGIASSHRRVSRREQLELEEEVFSELNATRIERDEHHRRMSANEHIIPLDYYD